jgi:hypothetical protein
MTGPTYLDDDEQMYFDPADAGAFVAAVARGDHQTAREVVGWDAPAEDLEALADRLALSSTLLPTAAAKPPTRARLPVRG